MSRVFRIALPFWEDLADAAQSHAEIDTHEGLCRAVAKLVGGEKCVSCLVSVFSASTPFAVSGACLERLTMTNLDYNLKLTWLNLIGLELGLELFTCRPAWSGLIADWAWPWPLTITLLWMIVVVVFPNCPPALTGKPASIAVGLRSLEWTRKTSNTQHYCTWSTKEPSNLLVGQPQTKPSHTTRWDCSVTTRINLQLRTEIVPRLWNGSLHPEVTCLFWYEE